MMAWAIHLCFAVGLLGCLGGSEQSVETHDEPIQDNDWQGWVNDDGISYTDSCDDYTCGCPDPWPGCWLVDCGCTFDANWECSGRCLYECE